jgi:hypothetical protein
MRSSEHTFPGSSKDEDSRSYKSLNRKVSDNIQIYADRLRLLLADGVRAGLIRQDLDLEAAALLLFGMIQGLVNVWALSGFKFDLTDRYSQLWKVYKQCLAPL